MSDGKVAIETELDERGVKKGLDELEKNLKGIGKLGDVFKDTVKGSETFEKSFSGLSSVIGSTSTKIVGSIAGIVLAFNKLYEVSKKNFFDNFKNIGNTLKPVGDMLKSFALEATQAFSSITGFQFSFSSMIEEAVEFESTMASVAAVMGATGDGINQITQTARQFGAQTRYSATQVAEAFTYMGKQTCSVIEKSIA